MNDGTEDQVKVSFPAAPAFSRVGRVAVAGLALRLGVDIAEVERLRLAVDRAVAALSGRGRITISLSWQPQRLTVTVGNPDHRLDEDAEQALVSELGPMVDDVQVGDHLVDLTVTSRIGSNGSA